MAPLPLQQITDAYGNWMSNLLKGNGIKFTASTDYAAHSEYLERYYYQQVTVSVSPLEYESPQTFFNDYIYSDAILLTNDSDQPKQMRYRGSLTVSRKFTWTTQQPMLLGIDLHESVVSPDITDLIPAMSASLDLGAKTNSSAEDTQEWAVDELITVPAHTTIQCMFRVIMTRYELPWTAPARLNNAVAVWYNDKVPGPDRERHWLYFYPIDTVITECSMYEVIDTSGYRVSDTGNVFTEANGLFVGIVGTSSEVIAAIVL